MQFQKWVLYMQPSRRCCVSGSKIKAKTGNHKLVEDTEKQAEKFRPWKKSTKDRKTSPGKTSRGINSQEE